MMIEIENLKRVQDRNFIAGLLLGCVIGSGVATVALLVYKAITGA